MEDFFRGHFGFAFYLPVGAKYTLGIAARGDHVAEEDGAMGDEPHFYEIFSEFEVPEKVSVHLHTNQRYQ